MPDLDVSVDKLDEATAVAVVLSYPELNWWKQPKSEVKSNSLMSQVSVFPRNPVTLEACGKIKSEPDLVMVDGQGIAHPRRIGLASHLGLFLNVPTIGCAKSHLYRQF